jgi:hypothetical protein
MWTSLLDFVFPKICYLKITLRFREMTDFVHGEVCMLYQTFLIEREESSVYIVNIKEGDTRKNCPNGQILNPSLSSAPVLS